MNTPTVVIKYGGHAMEDPALAAAFAQGLASLAATGMRLVVVHGGGPQINTMLTRLNIESHFEHGLRVTNSATMDVVEMILCGQVNKAVVSQFIQHGVRAVGICGKDACLLQAKRINPLYGLVGEVDKVDARIVQTLLQDGFLPVIAPVAAGSEGESLNINADTAAGALAGVLHADYFVLVSDVAGVLDKEGRLIPTLDRAGIQALKTTNVIYGGMIPKVDSCLHALDAGCARALILDGRAPNSLKRALLDNAPLGTVVEN